MEISDVRVRLVKDTNDRLKAVCSITLDDEFVVRDVKVVEGTSGLFVAMPSRKLSAPCPKCRTQNYLRAKYCSECGAKLPSPRIPADAQGREKAHRDIAHPITAAFRQAMQEKVLEAYRAEFGEAETVDQTPSSYDSEPQEIDGNASEYDQLIADLKGSPELRGDNGPDETSDERRGRRRRRGGRRHDREERPVTDDRVEERTATTTSDSGVVAFDSAQEAEADAFNKADDLFDTKTDTLKEPAEPAHDRASGAGDLPAPDETETKSSEADDSDEDTTAFGEGIL